MRKTLIILGFIAFSISPVHAQNSGVGIGIIVGDPTGFSIKSWHSRTLAVDGAVAWSATDDKLQIHADYLLHNFSLFRPRHGGQLPFYYGLGGSVIFGDDAKVSVRIPLGLDYLFRNYPLDFFVELVPKLNIIPDTEFEIDAALGIRIYFL